MPRLKQTVFEKQEARKRARTELEQAKTLLDLLPMEIRCMTRDYLTMSLLDDLNDIARQRSSIAHEQCQISEECTKVSVFMAEVDWMGESLRHDFAHAHRITHAHCVFSAKIDDYERELKDRRDVLTELDRKLLRAKALLLRSFEFRTIHAYAERATNCKPLL